MIPVISKEGGKGKLQPKYAYVKKQLKETTERNGFRCTTEKRRTILVVLVDAHFTQAGYAHNPMQVLMQQ
eukprot:11150659-Ditylum_brightwellii.AAC.1